MYLSGLISRKSCIVLQCLVFFFAMLWSGAALASQESEILLAKGNKYYLDGDYVRAQQELLQAAALDPTNPEIRVLLGVSYFASKNYDEAETEFTEALRLDPEVPRGKFYLGATAFYLNRYSEAERLLKEAQAQNPQDGLVQYYLSLVCMHQNRSAEAKSYMDAANLIAPNYMGPFLLYEQGMPRRNKSEKPFSINFYSGIEYDDNFKILPDQITIPNVPSVYPGGRATWRVPIVLEANYKPFRRDQWEAGIDYFFYSGSNFTIPNFDFLNNRGDAYVKYTYGQFVIRPWVGVDFSTKSLERYSFFTNAGLALSWQPNSFTNTDLLYRYQNRSFRYPTSQAYDRTGYLNEIGLFQTIYFSNKAAWRFGGFFARELTNGVNWDNKNFSFITDASINLPYQFNLWAYFQYWRYNFDNVDIYAGVRQRQNYYQVSFQLRRPLRKYVDVIVGYTHVNQISNIPDFTYYRNIYQLLLNFYY